MSKIIRNEYFLLYTVLKNNIENLGSMGIMKPPGGPPWGPPWVDGSLN